MSDTGILLKNYAAAGADVCQISERNVGDAGNGLKPEQQCNHKFGSYKIIRKYESTRIFSSSFPVLKLSNNKQRC